MNNPEPIRILNLQPFFGGSHRNFIEGWQKWSRHQWTTLSLPARHWKWRMRHAAIEFSRRLGKKSGADFDLVFATDMLNLAEWKGLAGPAFASLPSVLYFHENQFEYPNRFPQERDLHFGFTNFVSALSATEVWFNSAFNRDTFFEHLDDHAARLPDFSLTPIVRELRDRTRVVYPGIISPVESETRKRPREPLHLLWSARWEHDKNPDALLEFLIELRKRNVNFRLSVIGQSFQEIPAAFKTIETEFQSELVRFGFQQTREEYWEALLEADAFISTADHEFFGLSAMESVAAGCIPILPDRLAYPETIEWVLGLCRDPGQFRYGKTTNELPNRVAELADWKKTLPRDFADFQETLRQQTKKIEWEQLAPQYDAFIRELAANPTSSACSNQN